MAFVVVYDACVLWSAPVRDLLIRVAVAGLVQAKWSDEILDEVFRTLLAKRNDLSNEKLVRTRVLMNQAVPDCLVTGHLELVDGLSLPDPGDRHVLAVAVRSSAQLIVTFNTSDFPAATLAPYQIEAVHPDDFVLDMLDLAEATVLGVLHDQAAALQNPTRTVTDLIGTLERCGLTRAMTRVRTLLGGG